MMVLIKYGFGDWKTYGKVKGALLVKHIVERRRWL
jgi:hypothetical protein